MQGWDETRECRKKALCTIFWSIFSVENRIYIYTYIYICTHTYTSLEVFFSILYFFDKYFDNFGLLFNHFRYFCTFRSKLQIQTVILTKRKLQEANVWTENCTFYLCPKISKLQKIQERHKFGREHQNQAFGNSLSGKKGKGAQNEGGLLQNGLPGTCKTRGTDLGATLGCGRHVAAMRLDLVFDK